MTHTSASIDVSLAIHAEAWAQTIVQVLRTPFPYLAGHMSRGEADCDVTPWSLHPCFHASLDWHSSCHMQASAVRLIEEDLRSPGMLSTATRDALVAELDSRLTVENAGVEAAYLRANPGYERPYGWAWLTKLAAAAQASTHPHAPMWSHACDVIVEAVIDNLLNWLPKLVYPVRTGQHDNTAFGLLLLREGLSDLGHADVVTAIDEHALRLFEVDVDYPTRFEPSGNDFLSAALSEALLMRTVFPADRYAAWLCGFLPRLGADGDRLLDVPQVLDLTDGKLVHLFGLGLFRAEALAKLSTDVSDVATAERLRESAHAQFAFALDQIRDGDFMSTHWLVSFALRAVDALAARQ